MRTFVRIFGVLVWATLVGSGGALGQGGPPAPPPYPEQNSAELLNAYMTDTVNLRPTPLGNDLMGDSIDLDTGTLTLSATDVFIPGNSALEVSFSRTHATNPVGYHLAQKRGNWTIGIPHLATVYSPYNSWDGFAANAPGTSPYVPLGQSDRCSALFTVNKKARMTGWSLLGTPAGGQLLRSNFEYLGQFNTLSNWKFTCGVNVVNAHGEGFLAKTPQGHTYRFDHIVDHTTDWASEVEIWPTEVTDVHGNWVRYEYDENGPTRIYSNDGREILIDYSENPNDEWQVFEVTANEQTWRYRHGLSRTVYHTVEYQAVVLPDGRQWEYTYDGGGVAREGKGSFCHKGALKVDGLELDFFYPEGLWTIKHPDGAIGKFKTKIIRHGETSGVPVNAEVTGEQIAELNCVGPNVGPFYNTRPAWFSSLAVIEKTLELDPGNIQTWTYEYSQPEMALMQCYDAPVSCVSIGFQSYPHPGEKRRTIIDPTGAKTVVYIDTTTNVFSTGKEFKRERYATASSTTPIQVIETSYEPDLVVDRGGFDSRSGFPHFLSFPKIQTINVGDATYTTEYAYVLERESPRYAYNRPSTITQYSSLSPDQKRITDIQFSRDESKWIWGLVKSVTRNGKLFDSYTHDDKGQVTEHRRFGTDSEAGALYTIRTYHASGDQAGLLASVKDAANRTTYLDSWYRGIPKTVTRPDGLKLTRKINDFGQVTSFTDAKDLTTSYAYDEAGWLTTVTRPGYLASTSITYDGRGSGSMIQTATTGSLRETTTYDAFLRPTLEQRTSLANGGGSIFIRTGYDGLGRVTFRSLPTGSAPALTGTGVITKYDALGRVVQTQETEAPNATTMTEYLDGNCIKVTDPEDNVTITCRSGFGSPDDGNPRSIAQIAQPEGMTTTMDYDIHGNLLTAVQGGVTQRWFYDDRFRLCQHHTPETGATLYEYNNANEMIAFEQGATGSTDCSLPSNANKVTHEYDELGRLIAIDYADSTPDVALDYDANSNLKTNTRGDAVWRYQYNTADQLKSETLEIDGRSFRTRYWYSPNGYNTTRITPAGRQIQFNPNGFGQPTKLRQGSLEHLSNITYHPNGQMSGAKYSNGYELSTTLSPRQLITSVKNTKDNQPNATFLDYTYDANGRVTDIKDMASGGRQAREYTYDGLGRLATARGPWNGGTTMVDGSFTYDERNNLTQKKLGSRTVDIEYWGTGSNRVRRRRDSADGNTWRGFSHDARGNVTNNNRFTLEYDLANQPIAIPGSGLDASFVYDGHFRRVKQVINGETIYSIYGIDGVLLCRDNITKRENTEYFPINGRTFVRIHKPYDTGGYTRYMHHDHLGSPVAETSPGTSGTITWRASYTPFGEPLDEPAANDNHQGFTGHVYDTDLKLNYMQARYYDPQIGRFYASDPVGFAEGGVGFFNRYAYTANDPVNLVDPDGREPQDRVPMAPMPSRFSPLHKIADLNSKESRALTITVGALSPVDEAVVIVAAAKGIANAVKGAVNAIKSGAKALDNGASSARNGQQLQKQLASESQMADLASGGGTVISQPAKSADRIAAQTGIDAQDVQKVTSDAFEASDGTHIQTHAFRNAQTNELIEPKTIIDPSQ